MLKLAVVATFGSRKNLQHSISHIAPTNSARCGPRKSNDDLLLFRLHARPQQAVAATQYPVVPARSMTYLPSPATRTLIRAIGKMSASGRPSAFQI